MSLQVWLTGRDQEVPKIIQYVEAKATTTRQPWRLRSSRAGRIRGNLHLLQLELNGTTAAQ